MHIHRDTYTSLLKRKKYIKTVIVFKGTNHDNFNHTLYERSVKGQIVFSAVQTMHPSYNYSNLPLKWESNQRQTSVNGRDCVPIKLYLHKQAAGCILLTSDLTHTLLVVFPVF